MVPTQVALYDAVSNTAVEQLHRLAGDLVRLSGTVFALTSGQIQRRSAPALGKEGMARKSGHRTPEEMATNLGGVRRQDAVRAMRDGKHIHETQTTDTAEKTGTDPIDTLTGEPVTVDEPWLIGVGRARTQGMSLECADAIRIGLGQPTLDVTAELLRVAADRLCAEAERLGPDRLLLRARRVRDELDAAGIGMREEERRQRRSLTFTRQRDGMSRVNWIMDTETAAVVGEVYDRATSPKLGGPRTGTGPDADIAARIIDDDRTPTQLASDTFTQLLVNGVAADASLILGTDVPAVRLLTTAPLPGQPAPAHPRIPTTTTVCPNCADTGSLDRCNAAGSAATTDASEMTDATNAFDASKGTDEDDEYEYYEVKCQNGQAHTHTRRRRVSRAEQPHQPLRHTVPADQLYGPGWIEGQTEPVSAETIARLACTGSTSTITFDETGTPIDVSAEQRLYTRRQRRALGARDGGCMWTDSAGTTTCTRPPSWTEAHHVEHWDRDGGKTTIANGILLCKHHHLTLHNDGWEIHRVGTRYWLIPPAAVEITRTPRLIKSRSDAYRQLDNLVHGPRETPTPDSDTTDSETTDSDTTDSETTDSDTTDSETTAAGTSQPNIVEPDSASAPGEPTTHTTATGLTYRIYSRRNNQSDERDGNRERIG
jgi:hypothetical protein